MVNGALESSHPHGYHSHFTVIIVSYFSPTFQPPSPGPPWCSPPPSSRLCVPSAITPRPSRPLLRQVTVSQQRIVNFRLEDPYLTSRNQYLRRRPNFPHSGQTFSLLLHPGELRSSHSSPRHPGAFTITQCLRPGFFPVSCLARTTLPYYPRSKFRPSLPPLYLIWTGSNSTLYS